MRASVSVLSLPAVATLALCGVVQAQPLVAAVDDGGRISTASWNGAGFDALQPLVRLPGANARSIAAGDFDGDGNVDLVATSRGLDLADFDHDGHLDLVRGRSGGQIDVHPGNGDGTFGAAGDDRLFGGGGDDLLDGGPGLDRLVGQRGVDVCNGGEVVHRSCEISPLVP